MRLAGRGCGGESVSGIFLHKKHIFFVGSDYSRIIFRYRIHMVLDLPQSNNAREIALRVLSVLGGNFVFGSGVQL